MEIEARVAEIQKLKITEIKTLAENLGYSKPDSVTWKDAASAIAKLELEKTSQEKQEKETTTAVAEPVQKQLVKENYMKQGKMYCGCDLPLTTDTLGNPTCHNTNPDCPKNKA